MLKLVKINEEYLDDIASYKKELIDYNSSFDGTSGLKNEDDLKQWVKDNISYESYDTMPKGCNLVPAYEYYLVREEDNKVVGLFNVRLELNDFLMQVGGNIGYCIRPLERNQGYAKIGLKLVLDEMQKMGYDKALVTCNEFNIMSEKVIRSQGGMFDGVSYWDVKKVNVKRFWIPLKFVVNDIEYKVIRFLGRGKDAYSYLVEDNNGRLLTLKKMHHESGPYIPGKKIEQEINSYNRIYQLGIRIPKLIYIDIENEIVLKEYINGPTIQELINEGANVSKYIPQVYEMDALASKDWLSLNYLPSNFAIYNDLVYYIDYECNIYSDDNNFDNWGIKTWKKTN